MSGRYCIIGLTGFPYHMPGRFPYDCQFFPWIALCDSMLETYGLDIPPRESLSWVPQCFLPANLIAAIDEPIVEYATLYHKNGDFAGYLIHLMWEVFDNVGD